MKEERILDFAKKSSCGYDSIEYCGRYLDYEVYCAFSKKIRKIQEEKGYAIPTGYPPFILTTENNIRWADLKEQIKLLKIHK